MSRTGEIERPHAQPTRPRERAPVRSRERTHEPRAKQPEALLKTDSLALLTGRSNRPLAESVRRNLQGIIGEEIEVFNATSPYPDTEIGTTLENVRGKDVFIIQPTSARFDSSGPTFSVQDSLMELIQMANNAKRSGAKRVSALVPYYGYARSDRETTRRQPIGASLVTQMIEEIGHIDALYTMDLHAGQIQGLLRRGQWIDFSPAAIFAELIREQMHDDLSNVVVVAPDTGAIMRSERLAKKLGIETDQTAYIVKKRISPTEVKAEATVGNVAGKRAILVDDILSTGGTLEEAARKLCEEDGATGVDVVVTHGLFIGNALERLSKSPYIRTIYTTNSVEQRDDIRNAPKVVIADIGNLLAQVIYRFHNDLSLTELNE